MKKHFFEQYDYSEKDKKDIFSSCLFVFDTNVLLNLYRYTITTRDQLLDVMRTHKDRIWIPYQVGWEFFNNRRNVIESVSKFPKELIKILESQKNQFISQCKKDKHPSIQVDKIEELYSDFYSSLSKSIEKWIKNDPDYIKSDIVWDTLTDLLDGSVGEDFDDSELKKIYVEGKARYENKIPPGYRDYSEKKKEMERRLYGDLIIWKQIMVIAKSKDKDIIFITDDNKEDWYNPVHHGETKRARLELIKEFALNTGGKRIMLYNQDTFLHYIEHYLGTKVRKETKDEIKEVSTHSSNRYKELWSAIPGLYASILNDGDYQSFVQPNNLLCKLRQPNALEYYATLFGSKDKTSSSIINPAIYPNNILGNDNDKHNMFLYWPTTSPHIIKPDEEY